MAISYVEYVGDGVTTTFSVPFPYIDQSHVSALVSDVSTAFVWLTSSSVSITPAPANGSTVRIGRSTPTDLLVTFTGGNLLTKENLNLLARQALYRSIEAEEAQPLPTMPAPENRTNTLFSYDEDGAFELRPFGSIFDVNGVFTELPDNAVTTDTIAPDAVTAEKLADNAVGAEHIQAGAVGDSELAGNIPDSKLAQAPANTLKGNPTGSTAALANVTVSQITAMLLAGVSFGSKQISGWTYANNASDATNDIDIAAGAGADSTGAVWLTGTAKTKRLDAAWAAGTNQGGMSTGSTLTDADFWILAIGNPTTGAADYLFVQHSITVVLPAGYTHYRIVGWFRRASGSITPFKIYETDGGGIEFRWVTKTADISSAATVGSAARTLFVIRVPLSISVKAEITFTAVDASVSVFTYITCPDDADQTSDSTTGRAHGRSLTTAPLADQATVRTNTAGQIGVRADSALGGGTIDNFYATVLSWTWSRR